MSDNLFAFLVIEGATAGMMLFALVLSVTVGRGPGAREAGHRLAGWYGVCGNFGASISAVTAHRWVNFAGYVACGALAAAWLWWRRKKRRNVAALLGAKSRALRDALVKRAREAGTPRQVLRQVPVPS